MLPIGEAAVDRRDLAVISAVIEIIDGLVAAAPEDRMAMLIALRRLPPRRRAIVVLRYLQDLSESDTADALGISVGAVKSGAARGLAQLRAAQPDALEEARHD